ncbi:MAG TPA: outer membrane protein assembly factor BamA [Methylococcaceae bacterium]|nr:outer membrane protein assembly factor BamA [Methylococcaceae bacterium]
MKVVFHFVFFVLLFALTPALKAEDSFVVEEIKVNGLQRIAAGTVYNYLPVTVGQRFYLNQIASTMKGLFKTGFFKDINLIREGNVLVINVLERPSIAKIIFKGNIDLSDEVLEQALTKIGLAEGKVFNRQVLEQVEKELRRQYFSHGKYGLRLETKVANLTRNRVGIKVDISEGSVAKIKKINIVGSRQFDMAKLLGEFELTTSNWLSFYTKDDQYSKQKLGADLERLSSYYLDRGYINFKIDSTQVAITPDKKSIYVTVNIDEGDLFTLDKVRLTGNLVVNPEELITLVSVGPEEVFSRKRATDTSKSISDRLGEEGYVFANVNMIPEIDNDRKTIDMTFFVDPGKKIYVRHVNIAGNTTTRDEVLRREMRQMESAIASTTKIERSKIRLQQLGFFEQVTVETPPVVGATDEMDVNYKVVERASGNMMAGFGFSQTQGLVLNASISQNNVLGSGKRVDLNFNNSDVTTVYSFGFYNPYFTDEGVSLGYNLNWRETNSRNANTAFYSMDTAGASMNFGIPINETDRLRFNLDVNQQKLKDYSASGSVYDAIQALGSEASYTTFGATIGWSHNTLNSFIFPTSGGQQRLSASATVPGSDITYFKVGYKHQEYFPVAKDVTFRVKGEIAYGGGYGDTKNLPFFQNFYAGGVQTLRGFNDNTVGPKDSQGRPWGGSTKLLANAELLFPVPFFEDNQSMRLGTFVDAGMVSDGGFDTEYLRFSFGLSGTWLSPFGAITVSTAMPMNTKENDDIKMFQFSMGSNF